MFRILVVDPCPEYPQFDVQIWTYLSWQGTAHPMGRRVGEWVWVGRA